MGIKELVGMESDPKVRYAIVGLGDIAQEDMMPGVDHTGNSRITALITSDPTKATELGRKYDVEATYTYEQFDEALASGTFDAIYLATPNWRHAEFIIPALKSGIHVLTEKPLEISTAQSRKILEAEAASSAKLMWLIGFTSNLELSTQSRKSGQDSWERCIYFLRFFRSWSILIITGLRMGSWPGLSSTCGHTR